MSSSELDEFVEQVRERSDIYSVVSRYVSLNQRSGKFWGLCPFHNEKTPSFTVDAGKGFFYCFGCHAGGNVFKFISLIENISYFEAIKLQAERLGIPLPHRKLSPEEERRRREEKNLLKANEFAQDFFHECLIKTARGEVGRKYLAGRGITAETIETFKLGFATDSWDDLLMALTRRGFSAQQLETVGLVKRRGDGSGYYDRFRGRVMIPINDVFGRTVAFGGRILNTDDENAPKYLNSPETALFNKRNLLFGLDKAHLSISSAGSALVVEGYMDAISVFDAGIKNVVATLGTAFTPEHAKLLLRYARKIIFCYDSDEAGQRATMRALPIVQTAGAEVAVMKVPDGKDPDEFIRKHGKAAFETLIKNAVSLVDYRLNYVLEHFDCSTTRGKMQALQEILPVVVDVKNRVLRDDYIKKISSALLLNESIVRNELEDLFFAKRNSLRQTVDQKNSERKDSSIRAAGETLLRMAWHDNDLITYITTIIPREAFVEVHQEILGWMVRCMERNIPLDDLTAAMELSEAANEELSRIILHGAGDRELADVNAFEDSSKILQLGVLRKKYYALLEQAKKYEGIDDRTFSEKIRESHKIKDEMDNL